MRREDGREELCFQNGGHTMTDNEIIKALEHCSDNGECKDCPANPHIGNCGCCMNGLMKRAHDLINRQKAEIAELEAEIDKQYEDRKSVV